MSWLVGYNRAILHFFQVMFAADPNLRLGRFYFPLLFPFFLSFFLSFMSKCLQPPHLYSVCQEGVPTQPSIVLSFLFNCDALLQSLLVGAALHCFVHKLIDCATSPMATPSHRAFLYQMCCSCWYCQAFHAQTLPTVLICFRAGLFKSTPDQFYSPHYGFAPLLLKHTLKYTTCCISQTPCALSAQTLGLSMEPTSLNLFQLCSSAFLNPIHILKLIL